MIKITEQNEPLEHVTQINDCVTLVTRGIDVTLISKYFISRFTLIDKFPVHDLCSMSQNDFWKTHPIALEFMGCHPAWHRSISGKLIKASYSRNSY